MEGMSVVVTSRSEITPSPPTGFLLFIKWLCPTCECTGHENEERERDRVRRNQKGRHTRGRDGGLYMHTALMKTLICQRVGYEAEENTICFS